jgi:hypothetical protein
LFHMEKHFTTFAVPQFLVRTSFHQTDDNCVQFYKPLFYDPKDDLKSIKYVSYVKFLQGQTQKA